MPEHAKSVLPEASPYASHIPALDGVRGLAVLGVMASHLFPGSTHDAGTRLARYVLAFGANGVDLFFVLSGFLITGILFDSLAREQHFFRKFYARRMLRIFPLYYGILLAYALCSRAFRSNFHGELLSLSLFLQNTRLLAQPLYAYTGPSSLPLSHFWSLAVEEQFYFVWPLVVFLVARRRSLLRVCLGFFLLCPTLRTLLFLHGWGYYPVHQNTLLRADALLAGAALALLLRGPHHDKVLRAAPWATLTGALCIAASILEELGRTGVETLRPSVCLSLRYSVFALLFSGLLTLSLQPGWFSSLCRLRVLRSLGVYSYGLYVFHLIVFSYLEMPLHHSLRAHITQNKLAIVVVTGLISSLLSVFVAVLSYHLYEKRFLRLKRYFDYRHRSEIAMAQ